MSHACVFPQVLIEEGDEDEEGNLRAGMHVLTPCSCGETPLENLEFVSERIEELEAAILAVEPLRALYHWAPRARRKQILRYGLRPGMRCTTTTENLGGAAVCFADSPSWAWALSGNMPWTPDGEWDLWMVWQDRLVEPIVLTTPNRPSGIYEVRTEHRVYKRDVWYVGSRLA